MLAAHYSRTLVAFRAAYQPDGRAPVRVQRRGLRAVSYASKYTRAREWIEEREALYRRHARMMSIAEMVADPELVAVDAIDGFETIRAIRADIELLTPRPTDFQLELIWWVVELMAPRIFGSRWDTDQTRIRRRLGWTSVNYGIGAALTGRKEGKSTGFAMGVTVTSLNIPGLRTALFSLTRDQACLILDMTKSVLDVHPHRNDFRYVPSARQITLSRRLANGNLDERTIKAWSGSANVRSR